MPLQGFSRFDDSRSMLRCYVRQLIDAMSRVFFGLRFRLLLLVLLACAPLVGLTLHTASKERRREVAAWRERARQHRAGCAPGGGDLLSQTRQLLLAVSESSAVRSGSPEACKKSLDEVFASYPGYANLGSDRHQRRGPGQRSPAGRARQSG